MDGKPKATKPKARDAETKIAQTRMDPLVVPDMPLHVPQMQETQAEAPRLVNVGQPHQQLGDHLVLVVAHRCERCQHEKEEAEAKARGWSLLGPAPAKGPGYRRYRHDCGHEQTIARANMQSGRFNCAACGEGWSTAPSHIYCMRFTLPGLEPLVKLGFSRNPDSRLNWQLKRSPDMRLRIHR